MVFLSTEQAEYYRKEGIDAHNAGWSRSHNPHSYEASQCWDAGWLQAQQAALENQSPPQEPTLAQLNALAIDALSPPRNDEERDAIAGLAKIREALDKARNVAQKAAQLGLYNDPDVCWLLDQTDRG